MTEREYGQCIIGCDNCFAALPPQPNYYAARKAARAEGYTQRKTKDGVIDLCPDCAKEFDAERKRG